MVVSRLQQHPTITDVSFQFIRNSYPFSLKLIGGGLWAGTCVYGFHDCGREECKKNCPFNAMCKFETAAGVPCPCERTIKITRGPLRAMAVATSGGLAPRDRVKVLTPPLCRFHTVATSYHLIEPVAEGQPDGRGVAIRPRINAVALLSGQEALQGFHTCY